MVRAHLSVDIPFSVQSTRMVCVAWFLMTEKALTVSFFSLSPPAEFYPSNPAHRLTDDVELTHKYAAFSKAPAGKCDERVALVVARLFLGGTLIHLRKRRSGLQISTFLRGTLLPGRLIVACTDCDFLLCWLCAVCRMT
jgi:hypothetical protein